MSTIVSFRSAYGHSFMPTDAPEHESCLTCGATYALVADEDDPTRGEYMTGGGETPQECTGDTSRVHGYPGERPCDECDECDENCRHCGHDCNCLFCDS